MELNSALMAIVGAGSLKKKKRLTQVMDLILGRNKCMEKTSKQLMHEIIGTFRDVVCVQGPREGDKNGIGGCGNPVTLTLTEIYGVLEKIKTEQE